MKKTFLTKDTKPILSAQNTQEFIRYLDSVLMTVDIEKLIEIFQKFELTRHKDTHDFLNMGRYIFKKIRNKEENIELINVEERLTKCILCAFGKTAKAYDVEYKKTDSGFTVVYSSSYAINLNINCAGELLEFAWCNAFLSKREIEELRNI